VAVGLKESNRLLFASLSPVVTTGVVAVALAASAATVDLLITPSALIAVKKLLAVPASGCTETLFAFGR